MLLPLLLIRIINVKQRKSKAGLIVHSDRGSQYTSDAYNYLLKEWKCTDESQR